MLDHAMPSHAIPRPACATRYGGTQCHMPCHTMPCHSTHTMSSYATAPRDCRAQLHPMKSLQMTYISPILPLSRAGAHDLKYVIPWHKCSTAKSAAQAAGHCTARGLHKHKRRGTYQKMFEGEPNYLCHTLHVLYSAHGIVLSAHCPASHRAVSTLPCVFCTLHSVHTACSIFVRPAQPLSWSTSRNDPPGDSYIRGAQCIK